MQIIKDGCLVNDNWQHLKDDQDLPLSGDVTVSYQRWLTKKAVLKEHNIRVGLRINGDDPLESIGPSAAQFPLLVIEFPAVADGRGFSIARLLRDRYAYQGELRAYGHFIRDQVFFLQRVGINSFEPSADNAAELLPAFKDFSVRYQASQDEPLPIYRRR